MVGHDGNTGWTVDLEGLVTSHDPGCEDQIGISNGVVRMKMGEERSPDIDATVAKRRNASFERRRNAPDDPRSKVDEIWRIADHDCGCRTGAIRLRARVAGAQHHHLGLHVVSA